MKRRVLLTESQIKRRVKELARQIDDFYIGREIVLIGVLNGSIIFLADLVRYLKTPLKLDSIAASSYGLKQKSSKKVLFTPNLKISVKGAHVLMVDDILDTGHTISKLLRAIRSMKPASLESCMLLRKRVKRRSKVSARFVGFDIPNHFVYGYGLDFSEKFRNLKNIVYQTD
jgi:hypoxanthine phosphoribosyltransferase